MENQAYVPISCSIHDELESAAVLRLNAEMLYFDEQGAEQSTSERIVDIAIRNRQEFAVLADGTEIRLDRIKSFNGKENGTCAIPGH